MSHAIQSAKVSDSVYRVCAIDWAIRDFHGYLTSRGTTYNAYLILACPEKTVVCVIGDGGFQFTATELAVAVQEDIAITIVLCNNNSYGAIRASQDRNFGGRHFGCALQNPDFQKFAAAYGIPATRTDTLQAFGQALSRGIESGKLNLIELTVELCDP